MVAHCRSKPDLVWLADVLVALTGLRVGGLSALRWSDVDLKQGLLRLKDTSRQGSRSKRRQARTTKSRRDRVLPTHDDLRPILERLPRLADGRVFHGPKGGILKPDTLRTVLVREVLTPLAERFPAPPGELGFVDGRLHSFRHYFLSCAANQGVPAQVPMNWLGWRDSKLIKHYYHLSSEEGRRQMAKTPRRCKHSKGRRRPSRGVAEEGAIAPRRAGQGPENAPPLRPEECPPPY